MKSFALKLLMMSSRFLKRWLFTCFVPMSARLMSVGMYWMEILLSDTSSRMTKKRSAMWFILELKERFASACSVAVLSQNNGTSAKALPNPSSVRMFQQGHCFLHLAKADATSSTSMVDMAVRLCSADLKPIGASHNIDK